MRLNQIWGIPILLLAATVQTQSSYADGADVILGRLVGTQVYARDGDLLGITAGTTSCNAGNKVLSWHQLPNNQHPVISLNMYRLSGDRIEQIGQSWVKHGFLALQQNICGFGCTPNPTGNDGLGIGCSDPYSALNNKGPNLGSRGKINPFTGYYDGNTAGPPIDNPASPVARGLQVKASDLLVPKARYFIEGQYITPDDASAGNGHNNVSHMEVRIEGNDAATIVVHDPEPGSAETIRERPAILAWPYAQFVIHDDAPDDGQIYLGYRISRIARDRFRYNYAIYNMNSDRAVGSFSIPIGSHSAENVGFSAVASHDEAWSNDPWKTTSNNGILNWSTDKFTSNPSANAIRWGTAYAFWFETSAPPVQGEATVGYFKTEQGKTEFNATALVPSSSN